MWMLARCARGGKAAEGAEADWTKAQLLPAGRRRLQRQFAIYDVDSVRFAQIYWVNMSIFFVASLLSEAVAPVEWVKSTGRR